MEINHKKPMTIEQMIAESFRLGEFKRMEAFSSDKLAGSVATSKGELHKDQNENSERTSRIQKHRYVKQTPQISRPEIPGPR